MLRSPRPDTLHLQTPELLGQVGTPCSLGQVMPSLGQGPGCGTGLAPGDLDHHQAQVGSGDQVLDLAKAVDLGIETRSDLEHQMGQVEGVVGVVVGPLRLFEQERGSDWP